MHAPEASPRLAPALTAHARRAGAAALAGLDAVASRPLTASETSLKLVPSATSFRWSVRTLT